MSLFFIGLTILMSVGVGWSIGANDAANSIGTAVGSRVITLRQGIVLVAVFGFLGAYLQGSYVTKTIGRGIVAIDQLDQQMRMYVALVACFAAAAWVMLATHWKMPISTSHSIVGAVAGTGLAIGAPVKWRMLGDIFMCWILTPIGAAILGYAFFKVLRNVLPRIIPSRYSRLVIGSLIILSGCYVAYSWGANDVANTMGVVAGAGIMSAESALVLGGLAIVLGIVTYGYKVIETIGFEITSLLPIMAFSAQLASGINVHMYTLFGIPVSTSHSIVGAIFGVGLVKGLRVVNFKVMREIIICWIATPFISGLISFICLWGLKIFIKL
jgi:PiT family inorganic phosphate transporter